MSKSAPKNHVVETLHKLGLGENEAELYVLMLRYPKSTVQELQSRSPLPRTMLYYVLNRLMQIGLVSTIKEEWRTVYIAENPERLYELLADREREFIKDAENVRTLIPELKNKYRLAGERPDVRVLEGIDGYRKALEDIIISKPDVVRSYGIAGKERRPGIEIREAHEQRRIAKKIQKRVLLLESKETRQSLEKMAYNDYTQFRFISTPLEAFDVDVQWYAGKMLYTAYEGRDPIALIVEDKRLFQMQQSLFNSFWSQSKDATLLSFNTNQPL